MSIQTVVIPPTPDLAGLNAALTILGSDGGIIQLSAEVYELVSAFNIAGPQNNNVHVRGDNGATLRRAAATAGNQHVVRFNGVIGGSIDGVAICTASAPVEINNSYGVLINNGSTDIHLRQIEVHTTTAAAVVFEGPTTKRCSLEFSFVHDSRADGCRIASGASQCTIRGNWFYNTGDDAAAIVADLASGQRCTDCQIVGNTIDTTVGGNGIRNVGGLHTLISGNTISRTDLSGIFVGESTTFLTYSAVDTLVIGNNLYDVCTANAASTAAIMIGGGSVVDADRQIQSTKIMGNKAYGMNQAFIRLSGSLADSIIDTYTEGNTGTNITTGNGMRYTNATNTFSRGDIVQTSTGSGYLIANCAVVVIEQPKTLNINTGAGANQYGVNMDPATVTGTVIVADYIVTGTALAGDVRLPVGATDRPY